MVCLAVKLPCCFSNSIQAKKYGEGIKNNAEQRHSLSCCSVLSSAPAPFTTWASLQLTPSHGLVKQLPQYLLPQANVLPSHIVGAWENTCHSFCMNNKAEREGNFLGSQECGCRTEGSRTNGSTSTEANGNRTRFVEVWC